MNNENIVELKLNKKGQEYAKIYSSLLKDEFQRKRSYACLSALYAFLDYIESTPHSFTVQKSMTLFRNPAINEEFEISDLYINGQYIDFRVYIDGDAVLLPKVHPENGILPDYYAVVKVNGNLTEFKLQGFLDTQNMKAETYDYYYDSAALSQLISYDEFVKKIEKATPVVFDASAHNLLSEEYLRLTDNEIDRDKKRELINHMLQCEECRREFCCFTGFEMVSINTGKYPELTEDKTLDIIAAQAVEKGEYIGKEETIYIGDDPEVEETEKEKELEFEPVTEELPETQEILLEANESSNDYEIVEEEQQSDSSSDIPGAIAGAAGIAAAGAGVVAAASGVVAAASGATAAVESAGASVASAASSVADNLSDDDILDADINDIIFSSVEEQDIKFDDSEPAELVSESDNEVNNLSDDIVPSEINDNESEPDILDELFSIDEPLPEYLSVDGTSEHKTNSEPEMILKIDEDDNTVADEIPAAKSDLQKVIIDYDENGNPVYSYITSISDDENLSLDNEETAVSDSEEEDNLLLDDLDAEAVLNQNYEEDNIQEIQEEEPEKNSDYDNEKTDELTDVVADEAETSEDYIAPSTALTAASPKTVANQVLNEVQNSDDASDDELMSEEDFTSDIDSSEETGFSESIYDSQVAGFVNNGDDDEEAQDDDDEEVDDESEVFDDADEETDESEYDDENEEGGDEEYNEDDDEDEEDDEYSDSDNVNSGKKSGAVIIAAALAGLLLLGGIGGGAYYFMSQKNNNSVADTSIQSDVGIPSENPDQNMPIPAIEGPNGAFPEGDGSGENQPQQPENNDYQAAPLTENDLVPQNAPMTQDPNKAIAGAFSQNMPVVSFNGLNWQFNPKLFTNNSFKEFLRNFDSNLKGKIKNNLMNASESAPNKAATASITVNNDGELVNTSVTSSSGSQQIDDIVLQSIKECFDGQKTTVIPDGDVKSDNYNLFVVIKF